MRWGRPPKFQRGKNNSQAKITESDVPKIFQWRIKGVPVREIADRVGLRCTSIRSILSRDSWAHVPVSENAMRRVREMRPNRIHRCARNRSDRREYGHALNLLDHCRVCAEEDRTMRRVLARGDVCPVELRPGLWHRLGTFPRKNDVCSVPQSCCRRSS